MGKYLVTIRREKVLVVEAEERRLLASEAALEELAKRYTSEVNKAPLDVRVSSHADVAGTDREPDLAVAPQPRFVVPPAVGDAAEGE